MATKKRKMVKKLEKAPAKRKIKKVMEEYKEGELHSGSDKGPLVNTRRQAVAIALSEARRKMKKKKK